MVFRSPPEDRRDGAVAKESLNQTMVVTAAVEGQDNTTEDVEEAAPVVDRSVRRRTRATVALANQDTSTSENSPAVAAAPLQDSGLDTERRNAENPIQDAVDVAAALPVQFSASEDNISSVSTGVRRRNKKSKPTQQEDRCRDRIRDLKTTLAARIEVAQDCLNHRESVTLFTVENAMQRLGKDTHELNAAYRQIQELMTKRGISGRPVVHYGELQENLTTTFNLVEDLNKLVGEIKRRNAPTAPQARQEPQRPSLIQHEQITPPLQGLHQNARTSTVRPDQNAGAQVRLNTNVDNIIRRRTNQPRGLRQRDDHIQDAGSYGSGQTRPFSARHGANRTRTPEEDYRQEPRRIDHVRNDRYQRQVGQNQPLQQQRRPQPVLAPQCHNQPNDPYNPDFYDGEEPDYYYEGLRRPWNVVPVIPAAADDDLLKNIQKGRLIVFSGKPGTYHSWRQKFIQCIHRRRTGPSAKAFALQASLDQSDPHLRLLSSSISLDPIGYQQAIEELENRYGSDQQHCRERYLAVCSSSNVRRGDINSLYELDIKLKGYLEAMRAANMEDYLNFEDESFRSIVSKLDQQLSMRFSDWMFDNGYTPCLNNLSVFLRNELSRCRQHDNIRGALVNPTRRPPSRTFIAQGGEEEQEMDEAIRLAGFQAIEQVQPDCDACEEQHYLKKCPKFLGMKAQERFDLILSKKRCFKCLKLGHLVPKCTSPSVCKTCQKNHHTLLHGANPRRLKNFLANEEQSDCEDESEEEPIAVTQATFQGNLNSAISLPIAPVKLFTTQNAQRTIEVNALIDSGNTTTILSELAAKALGVTGYQDPVVIEGVGGKPITSNFYTRFVIKSSDGHEHAEVTARIVPQPTGGLKAVDWNDYKQRFPHLSKIDFVTPCKRKSVDVILGTNAGKLTRTLEADICGSSPDDPIAKRTPLGWVASGKLDPTVKSEDVKTYMSYFLRRELSQGPRCSTEIMTTLSSSASVANYAMFGASEDGFSAGYPGMKANSAAKSVLHSEDSISAGSAGMEANFAAKGNALQVRSLFAGSPGTNADSNAKELACCPSPDDSRVFSLLSNKPSSGEAEKKEENVEEDLTLSRLVEAQWAMEETPLDEEKALSQDEQRARQLLAAKGSFSNGQATMPVLWKQGEPSLANNFEAAKSLYLRTLRQPVMRNEESRNAYNAPLIKYRSKSYFVETPMGSGKYYLTHFGVYRKDKVTSQIRPVMNGAKKFDGKSLNDAILAGPKMINELPDVLLHFRRNKICLSCDIREMFLNVHLLPEDQEFHHFLWSETGKPEDIKDYMWTRHIFGNAGSPCCCIHAIKAYAQQREGKYPAAAYVVEDCTIVDDNLTSADSTAEVLQMIKELKLLYGEIGLTVAKFMSNCPAVMESLTEEERAPNLDLASLQASASGTPTLKALGVYYSAKEDVFSFKKEVPEKKNNVWTKREMLSFYASLFDPHGLISPIIIAARIAFQKLWLKDYGWDDKIKEEDAAEWLLWLQCVPDFPKLSIPRCLFDSGIRSPISERSLHVFCDASGEACGAAVYQLTRFEDGQVSSRLVQSRAKLAPIKTVTIPRLELVAAHLGTKLAAACKKTLGIEKVHYYTDSMNVICWLNAPSRQLLTFVANRVAKILRATPLSSWHWVSTHDNPADLASRGATTEELLDNDFWWKGPIEIMKLPPVFEVEQTAEAQKELKKGQSFSFAACQEKSQEKTEPRLPLMPSDFSSWIRLLRVLAWCRRFVLKLKSRLLRKPSLKIVKIEIRRAPSSDVYVSKFPIYSVKNPPRKDRKTHMYERLYNIDLKESLEPLQLTEIQWAENQTLAVCQAQAFLKDLQELKKNNQVTPQSTLIKLRPTLTSDGLIRMAGRLRASRHLGFETKCPIILPRENPITKLIILHYHERVLKHIGGTGHTLATLNERFWPIGGRQAVKACKASCIKCRRTLAIARPQEEAPLEDCRFLPTAEREVPFHTTGVDAAGPFEVKLGRGMRKSSGLQKRWFIIFACTVYRCIHVEMVSSLSADCFLEAFSRFLARKPRPTTVISDNGGNFRASSLILKELFTNLKNDNPDLSKIYPEIQWKLNTPLSPHQGGHYERLVGSMKKALALVLPSHSDLSEEQLHTCLVVCEGILNSRPLSYVSTDSNDLAPLTPAHFLLQKGYSDLVPISGSLNHTRTYGKRWMSLQLLLDRIWARFVKEIIPQLNLMNKWTTKREDMKPGDIVAILEEKARGVWPIGKIIKVFPNSKDGKVRRATVLSNGKEYERSLSRVVVIQEASPPK